MLSFFEKHASIKIVIFEICYNQQAPPIFLLYYTEELLTRSEPRWEHYLTEDVLQKKNCRHNVGLQELRAIHLERFHIEIEQIQKQTRRSRDHRRVTPALHQCLSTQLALHLS
jgi:hypothetical protein